MASLRGPEMQRVHYYKREAGARTHRFCIKCGWVTAMREEEEETLRVVVVMEEGSWI